MLIINATFAWFSLTDNVMTPDKAFTVISLFNVL